MAKRSCARRFVCCLGVLVIVVRWGYVGDWSHAQRTEVLLPREDSIVADFGLLTGVLAF